MAERARTALRLRAQATRRNVEARIGRTKVSAFIITTHGRLQEWVAEEKGYFGDEGLDYEFRVVTPALWSGGLDGTQSTAGAPGEIKLGAFESYERGRDTDVSCACHWTVNMAASAGHGRIWGEAYSVTPSAIFVPADSPIQRPEDLAGVPIAVGYHSGSHYSTIQALQPFLAADGIALSFGGLLHDRLALLLDGKVRAANGFGNAYYILEQLGFRKFVDSTFMVATMVRATADVDDVRRYFRALRRAQRDIDAAPERYLHYYLREIPRAYHGRIDVRKFGPGERIVFEPYSEQVFERTHRWIEELGLFPTEQTGHRRYADSVLAADA
jgi:hypothetical protein